MKRTLLLVGLFLQTVSLLSIQVVTQDQTSMSDESGDFYFFLVNNTGQDLSFCRKKYNPTLIVKPGTILKITENDLEVADVGANVTSLSWVQTSNIVKGKIYLQHGNFFIKGAKTPSLPLQQGHVYEVNVVDNEDTTQSLEFKEIHFN